MRHILLPQNAILFLSLAAAACGKSPDTVSADNGAYQPANEIAQAQQPDRPAPSSPPVATPVTVDPKSAVAAREVVVGYAGLIEGGKLPESRNMWTDGSDPRLFESQLQQFDGFQAEVGEPGSMEGAAGSSYINTPLRLTGRTKSGAPLTLAGLVTLRRVNDVPGSTEVQRRWHIYRVDLQPRP